jgi:hypothetical protein
LPEFVVTATNHQIDRGQVRYDQSVRSNVGLGLIVQAVSHFLINAVVPNLQDKTYNSNLVIFLRRILDVMVSDPAILLAL